MGYDKAPDILMQKCPGGWKPYGVHSPAMVDDLPVGQVAKLIPRKGRTIPRNAAYWAGLRVAIEATDAWPTTSHLHTSLKMLCGYVDVVHNPLTGRDEVRAQSTAFDKMSEAEFAAFFRLAQLKFTERMGFDPWAREPDGGEA